MSDNKYQQGKIYTIRSHQTPNFYIGSTCNPLYKRLYQHKIKYKYFLDGKEKKQISSFEIIKFDDAYIELLEDFKCENKEQLNKREGELIRFYKDNVVNKIIQGRTKIDYINEKKNHIKEQKATYYLLNKERIDNKNKEYHTRNLDKEIKQNICDCGGKYQTRDKNKHIKTKKHLKYLASL